MDKRVSLKDIAQKVGVSTALVSYVLNNQKENRIKKEVAQKIRDTAKALNYRTNQIARSLKMSKTFTLGLIVSNISLTRFLPVLPALLKTKPTNRSTPFCLALPMKMRLSLANCLIHLSTGR